MLQELKTKDALQKFLEGKVLKKWCQMDLRANTKPRI